MKLLIDLQKRKTYKWACTPCIILQKVSLIGLQKLTSSWHIKMSSLCSQWSENEALCLALGAFKKCYGPPVRRGKLCCFLVLEIELVFIQRTLDVSETWKRFLKVEEKKQTIKITKLYFSQTKLTLESRHSFTDLKFILRSRLLQGAGLPKVRKSNGRLGSSKN